jgi:lipopolysaccharide biosynthesis glycosyltransferase
MTLKGVKPVIYIGWDSREDIAYQVCKHSIENKTKNPTIYPLKQSELRDEEFYWREEDKLGSTEFTFTRFLVPELMQFNGWALFMDCDMAVAVDIQELFNQVDDKYAVMCVKHDYTPPEGTKMDGKAQLPYPRKNWSSVVLFNCGHPSNRKLTKELVNDPTTTGAYLHRFSWLNDSEIGNLSPEWNWLVNWYKEPEDGKPKIIHYTEGGPWFDNYKDCEYADVWEREKTSYEDWSFHFRKKNRVGPLEGLLESTQHNLTELLDIVVDPQGLYHDSSLEKFIGKISSMASLTPACYCFAEHDDPNERGYDRIAHKFALGSGGRLINQMQLETIDITVPVIVRGNSKSKVRAINTCIERGLIWYNIDTGYLGNGQLKHYHRISKGHYQNLEPIVDRPSDRLENIKFKIHKKKKGGQKILLCPPSQKVMSIYNLTVEEWLDSTIKEIKKHSKREIVVRVKDQNRKSRVVNDPITVAFDNNIYCVITYNSIAALEAVMYGLPAFTLGPNAAEPLCNTDLSKIESPYFPDAEEVEKTLRHLSYCQFTEAEFKDGTAWRIINASS